MTEKDVKKLLTKANNERLFGDTAEALAILHRLHNEYPNDITYLGLLASTYYDEKEYDIALEYCDKADQIEKNNANTLDLRGLIAYEKGGKRQAEEYYQKALDKDPLLIDCRLKLIDLLFEEKRYQEVVDECQFVLKNNDPDRNNYTVKELTSLFVSYLSRVYHYYWKALVELKQYKEAIPVVHEYIDLRSTTIKDPYFFDREEELLLKLYYLLGDKENTDKYEDRWKNHYSMSDRYINSMKKDTEQGYIIEPNFDNYEIDEKGRFL